MLHTVRVICHQAREFLSTRRLGRRFPAMGSRLAMDAADRDGRIVGDDRAGSGTRGMIGRRTWHPTVKPVGLMRWMVRPVTPPGGRALAPFAGSGSALAACGEVAVSCVAVERDDR